MKINVRKKTPNLQHQHLREKKRQIKNMKINVRKKRQIYNMKIYGRNKTPNLQHQHLREKKNAK